MSTPSRPRVLVKEKIADAGVDLLREHFDVDLGLEMGEEELADRIADYDAILIRSATQMTADLIDRAERLKVIGRAGTGVDNVDLAAARSTLSTPVPARPITLRRPARSIRSAVIWVAERIRIAS